MLEQTLQCKLVNIVWIERGILLTIIYYVLRYYHKLQDKIIIVDNIIYCDFLNYIFKNLTFKKFEKHKSNNFYFNIRKIIKKQDIIIDYLHNYDDIIYSKKLYLVPWYDMNDILIAYKYDKKKYINVNKYVKFIKQFSNCRRGNYYNDIWDIFIEISIYKKYIRFNKNFNIYNIFNELNKVVLSNYTDTINNNYYYIPINNIQPQQIQPQQIQPQNINPSEDTLNNLIVLLNNKIKTINKIL